MSDNPKPIEVTGWLPNLIGPLDLYVDGEKVDVPRRQKVNLVGATVEDEPDYDRTKITLEGGGGGEAAGAANSIQAHAAAGDGTFQGAAHFSLSPDGYPEHSADRAGGAAQSGDDRYAKSSVARVRNGDGTRDVTVWGHATSGSYETIFLGSAVEANRPNSILLRAKNFAGMVTYAAGGAVSQSWNGITAPGAAGFTDGAANAKGAIVGPNTWIAPSAITARTTDPWSGALGIEYHEDQVTAPSSAPTDGYYRRSNPSNHHPEVLLPGDDPSTGWRDLLDGGGEANTASNLISSSGSQVGFFKQKTSLDLEFRGLSVAPYLEFTTDTVKHHMTLKGLSSAPSDGESIKWSSGSGGWVVYTPSAGSTPAGSSGQVQWNNGGTFAGAQDVYMGNVSSTTWIALGTNSAPATQGIRLDSNKALSFRRTTGGSEFIGVSADASGNLYVGALSGNQASLGLQSPGVVAVSAGGDITLAPTGGAATVTVTSSAVTASTPITGTTLTGSTSVIGGGGSNYKSEIAPLVGSTTNYGALYFLPNATAKTANNPVLYGTSSSLWVNSPSGSGDINFAAGGAVITATLNTSLFQMGVPRVGYSSPYASEGEITITAGAGGGTYTLSAAEYSKASVIIDNSSASTYAFPRPAAASGGVANQVYFKDVENAASSTYAITISNGGAATVNLNAGKSCRLKFTNAGVFQTHPVYP